MSPSLDIVIVNFNAGALLEQCAKSIASQNLDGVRLTRVVLVDNASTDGSQRAFDGLGLPATVIENRANRGFAAACNQGAAGSKADYLLFLNPDTVLLPGSLIAPISFLEQAENAEFAICGIQLADFDGRIARSCSRFITPAHWIARSLGLDKLLPSLSNVMNEWNHIESREVDHVIGAFYLVRRAVFEELGGFDERFFVYLEDVDFSTRARTAGHKSYYLTGSRALHKGGGTSDRVKRQRLFYSLQSKIVFARKHFRPPAAALTTGVTLTVEPLFRIARAAAGLRGREVLDTVAAYGMLLRSPAVLGKRRS